MATPAKKVAKKAPAKEAPAAQEAPPEVKAEALLRETLRETARTNRWNVKPGDQQDVYTIPPDRARVTVDWKDDQLGEVTAGGRTLDGDDVVEQVKRILVSRTDS